MVLIIIPSPCVLVAQTHGRLPHPLGLLINLLDLGLGHAGLLAFVRMGGDPSLLRSRSDLFESCGGGDAEGGVVVML